MNQSKEPCPYTGHNGCEKMLARPGRAPHIKSVHPGLPRVPDAEGNWPAVTGTGRVKQGAGKKGTSDFLTDALNSIKVRREVLARRLAEIEAIENEDMVLAREEGAIQKALEVISAGVRSTPEEHPVGMREVHQSRSHAGAGN